MRRRQYVLARSVTIATLLVFCTSAWTYAADDPLPIGALVYDEASCSVAGWACDPSDYNQSIPINFTVDGSTYVGQAIANITSGSNSAVCNGTTNHQFAFSIPNSLKDGAQHLLYAYAINSPDQSQHTLLTGSPSTFQCAAPACTPNWSCSAWNQCVSGGQIQVSLVGTPQVVYEQTTAGICSAGDWLDSPARAWWDSGGKLHLITASGEPYAFLGTSLESLQRSCIAPVTRSGNSKDYDVVANSEWPTSGVFTEDGTNAFALLHNEWHEGCGGKAWSNTISLMQSSDGGYTFSRPSDYQVRVPLIPWNESMCGTGITDGHFQPVYGSFGPSNIIKKDGYYYSFFAYWAPPTDPAPIASSGTCIMRSKTIIPAFSWEVWTGSAWLNAHQTSRCEPVFHGPYGIGSITYSTYLKKYVAFADLSYATSDDLVQWTSFTPIPAITQPVAGDAVYFSLLSTSNDPSVTGRSFENIEQDAWLYYTILPSGNPGSSHRYLMRQKIRFEQSLGRQMRSCTDTNACGVSSGKPTESQSCIPTSAVSSPVGSNTGAATSNSVSNSQGTVSVIDSLPKHPSTGQSFQPFHTTPKTTNVPSGTQTSNPVIQSIRACPLLNRNLSLGSRGLDVTKLQQFLIGQKFLAAGNDTGYFGKLTQAAVRAYQRREGIISYGTPATTGYGAVGPRTRAALSRCN